MECTRYRESIQDLIDGTIGPIRRAELERHLEGCADCRALVADLETIRDRAASLDRLEPPSRVWLQIAGTLRQEGRIAAAPVRRASTLRHPALLAIAAALILIVGASLVLLLPRNRPGAAAPAPVTAANAPVQGNAPADTTVQDVESEFRLAEQHYQNAITKLEQAARLDQVTASGQATGDQATIDPATAAMLQKNLHVIDAAIAESRAALRTQPQSAAARDSLFDALKRKVALLQDTIALMNEMRKGNAAGAAHIIEGASKS
jgi:anti-sigma factor RsiW